MVSLSIRRLRELNLYEFFDFAPMGKIRKEGPSPTPKRVKFNFCSYQNFPDNEAFPERSH